MTDFAHLNDYILLANFKLQNLLNTLHSAGFDRSFINKTRNTCIAEPHEARRGGGHKMSGMEGERIEVNCLARKGGFQQWLCKYWKVRFN